VVVVLTAEEPGVVYVTVMFGKLKLFPDDEASIVTVVEVTELEP